MFNSNPNEKICARISDRREEIPDLLKDVIEDNSKHLNCSQKPNLVEHKIELRDLHPIKQSVRYVSFYLKSEVDEMVKDMHKQWVIEESSSSGCFPVVLKQKKDGPFRFCVYFRKLNDKTIKDSYPLPRIDQTLDKLAGSSWFSTLDLKSRYCQVKIFFEDREKTAFSIGNVFFI